MTNRTFLNKKLEQQLDLFYAENDEDAIPAFDAAIHQMHLMYKLPISYAPTVFPGEAPSSRIQGFIKTLQDEILEGNDVKALMDELDAEQETSYEDIERRKKELEALTALADWLGDIVVFCTSEALKWGIPLNAVLEIIMGANFTKLDENGQPIYDENGKFMKGPNTQKPEPAIMELLEEYRNAADE